MINCGCCGNTCKIIYEGEEVTCPVCEDYMYDRGKLDGMGEKEKQHDDIQSNPTGDARAVGKEVGRHQGPRS